MSDPFVHASCVETHFVVMKDGGVERTINTGSCATYEGLEDGRLEALVEARRIAEGLGGSVMETFMQPARDGLPLLGEVFFRLDVVVGGCRVACVTAHRHR